MKCHQPNNRIPLTEWANEVEQIFDRFLGKPEGPVPVGKEIYRPALDIAETEKAYMVSIDLPGVRGEDVKLEIHEDKLTISGVRNLVHKEEGKSFHRVERLHGDFNRTVVLPNSVDHDKIEANFHDGVLEVSLPKVEKVQPRKIEIKTTLG